VVVARGHEAELEPPWLLGIVEVRYRQRILSGVAGTVVEGRVEAVTALPAVLPILYVRSGHGAVPGHVRLDIVDARGGHALFAVRGFGFFAPRPDQLARLPAARQIALRRGRALRFA